MRIPIIGVAGFAGGRLARSFLRDSHQIVSFDNLRRRERAVWEAARVRQP
jgi:nucleoside-diphosphate-sugar epimerase